MNRGQSHCNLLIKNEDGCSNRNLQCSKRCNEYLHMNSSQKYRKEMIKRLQAALCFGIAQKKQPLSFKPTKSITENSIIKDQQSLRWRDLLSYYRANSEQQAQDYKDKHSNETQRNEKRQKDTNNSNNNQLVNKVLQDENKKDEKQQLFQSRFQQQNQENNSTLKTHNYFSKGQQEQLVQYNKQSHMSGTLNESALKVQFENQSLQAKLRQHEQNVIHQQHLQKNQLRSNSLNQQKEAVCTNRSISLLTTNAPDSFNWKQQITSQQPNNKLCLNQIDQPCIQSPRTTSSAMNSSRKISKEGQEEIDYYHCKTNSDNQLKKQQHFKDEFVGENIDLKEKNEMNIENGCFSIKDFKILEEIVRKQINDTLENLLKSERNDWDKALCEVKEEFTKRLSSMEDKIRQNSTDIKTLNNKFELFLKHNKDTQKNTIDNLTSELAETQQSQTKVENIINNHLEKEKPQIIQESKQNHEQQSITTEQPNLRNISQHIQLDYCHDKSNSQANISLLHQPNIIDHTISQIIPQISVDQQLESSSILPGSTQPTNQSPRFNITETSTKVHNPDDMHGHSLISYQSSWMNQPLSVFNKSSKDSLKSNEMLVTSDQLCQQSHKSLSNQTHSPHCPKHKQQKSQLKAIIQQNQSKYIPPQDCLEYSQEKQNNSNNQNLQLNRNNSQQSYQSNPTGSPKTPLHCHDRFPELSNYQNQAHQFQYDSSQSDKQNLTIIEQIIDYCQDKVSSTISSPEITSTHNLITPTTTSHHQEDTSSLEQCLQQPSNSPKNTFNHQLPVICEQENEEEFILYQLDEQGNLLDENGRPVVDEIGEIVSFSENQINKLRQYNILEDI